MWRRRFELLQRALLVLDVALLLIAFAVAYRLMPTLQFLLLGEPGGALGPWQQYAWVLVVVIPLWVGLLHWQGVYAPLRTRSHLGLLWGIAAATLLGTAGVTLVLYALKIHYSRILLGLFGLFSALLLTLERWAIKWFLTFRHATGYNRRNLLVLGSKGAAADLITRVQQEETFPFIGCLDPDPSQVGKEVAGVPVLGSTAEFRETVSRGGVDEVVVAMPANLIPEIPDIMAFCEEVGVKLHIMPDYQLARCKPRPSRARMGIEDFLGIPMMTVSVTSSKVGQLLLKEFLDFCGAAILLLLLSPLFLVIAVAIKMTSPGPLFYRWKVSGLNGREFTGYKFRTMVVDADELKPALLAQNERTGPVFKMTRDPRITPVGRVLRKFSLDELPQLWSVLKGDMSLVGPRPPLQTETEQFAYWQRRKLSVKPGVTGLWQVNGRGSVQDFNKWVQMDLEYIDNWSLWLDLKLLLKTIPAILRGTGV